uniref:Uncharacterized protein n=1 Tax=Cannabis sativa TaxID=3483 RepID=A0A803NSD8_CANSA
MVSEHFRSYRLQHSCNEYLLHRDNGGCDTTSQICITLKEYCTTLNRANIGQYRTLLRNAKMQGSLGDYLLKIKRLVNLLASIGHMISPSEHIEAIFNGLTSDYNVFITSVNTRTDTYSVVEIEALLMTQEVRLEKSAQKLDISKPETNLAHTKPFIGGRCTFSSPYLSNSTKTGFNSMSRGNQMQNSSMQYSAHYLLPGFGPQAPATATRGGQSRGTQQSKRGGFSHCKNQYSPWGQKVQCQLSHRLGHTVAKCFYRFDKSFQGPETLQSFA